METSQLRKRPVNHIKNDNDPIPSTINESLESNHDGCLVHEDRLSFYRKSDSNDPKKKWNLLTSSISVVVHLGGIILFVSGFILRSQFHNGQECDMTYSMREFLEIETNFRSNSAATKLYKLFKFVDRRDPRYRQLLMEKQQPLNERSNWCNGNKNAVPRSIVLFIPGHWGSYSQSRSVGAHGLQLTKRRVDMREREIVQALGSNLLSGDSQKEENFVYDVYSVDFAEQGAALHGQFLLFQSDFVASAVRQLAVSPPPPFP